MTESREAQQEVPAQTRGQGTGAHAASTGRETGRTPTTTPQDTRDVASEGNHWYGMIVFASVMMVLLGFFQVVIGLTALFQSNYYVVGVNGLLVHANYTAWGWLHLALGVVAIAAAVGLLSGRTWARAVGIAMAVVSAVANLAFMAAYPLWSILVIALDVIVIYAIAVHGREAQDY